MTDTKKLKAYVTSIGEKTEIICCEQLVKFGFDVVLLNKRESWENKYKRFIRMAHESNEGCLRVDADVIVNEDIKLARLEFEKTEGKLIFSCILYDLYRNGLFTGSPIFYTKKALGIIHRYQSMLHPNRPESSACRLDGINQHKYQSDVIVGMHGFFQNCATIEKAKTNKTDRKQQGLFDFDLVEKLMNL